MDGENYRILIVEDDENTARYIRTCLDMGKYRSEVCGDGCAAVKRLSEGGFDLVLLDVMLPGMGGCWPKCGIFIFRGRHGRSIPISSSSGGSSHYRES